MKPSAFERAAESDKYVATGAIGNHTLYEGPFMGMTSRAVIALDPDYVVMCYASKYEGACRVAASQNVASMPDGDASASDARLMPPLAWSARERFYDGAVARLELERLDARNYVACFERLSSEKATNETPVARIACVVGAVTVPEDATEMKTLAETDVPRLAPFGYELELPTDAAALVSVSVSAATRKFAVCWRETSDESPRESGLAENQGASGEDLRLLQSTKSVCRWAETRAGSDGVELAAAWVTDEPLLHPGA